MRISDWSSDVCSSDLGELGAVALDRGRAVGASLVAVAEELDAVGLARELHREMDMPPPRPAVDLSAARQRAVVGERQRGVLDDAPLTLVPIVLVRVREIDQDMPRPLREVVAMIPRSEEHTSELQSLMLTPYAVFFL